MADGVSLSLPLCPDVGASSTVPAVTLDRGPALSPCRCPGVTAERWKPEEGGWCRTRGLRGPLRGASPSPGLRPTAGTHAQSSCPPPSAEQRAPLQLTFRECRRQQDVLSLLALGIDRIEYHCDILLKTQIQDPAVSREGISIDVKHERDIKGPPSWAKTVKQPPLPPFVLLDEAHLSASSKISHCIRLK